MDLQLKCVKFAEYLSEETNAFTADVWFRGKKVGYAKNDGQGGCTFVHPYPKMFDEFKEASDYANKLPEIKYKSTLGLGDYTIKSNLENQVDKLFTKWADNREIKKEEKKGIFIENKDGDRSLVFWKGWTIKKLMANPQGKTAVLNRVRELKKEGYTILNTNLG